MVVNSVVFLWFFSIGVFCGSVCSALFLDLLVWCIALLYCVILCWLVAGGVLVWYVCVGCLGARFVCVCWLFWVLLSWVNSSAFCSGVFWSVC